jgi:hypothetical protein
MKTLLLALALTTGLLVTVRAVTGTADVYTVCAVSYGTPTLFIYVKTGGGKVLADSAALCFQDGVVIHADFYEEQLAMRFLGENDL